MNHHLDHNISANVINSYAFSTDTILLERDLSFKQITEYIGVSEEVLVFLNPKYKLKYIPKTNSKQVLCLPKEKVGLFLANEESIIADLRRKEVADSIAGKKKEDFLPESIEHVVRSGEFLGSIANKYHCTVGQLMAWNNKRSTRLNPGDRLTVYTNGKNVSAIEPVKKSPAITKNNGKFKVHVVRNGDTLWDIAKEYQGTTVNDLKKLNSNLNFKRLKPGMEVKVKEIS